MKPNLLIAILLAGLGLGWLPGAGVPAVWISVARAQEDDTPTLSDDEAATPEEPTEKPEPEAEGQLVKRQRQVADKFIELERLMLRMAELTGPSDPRRASLLRQAVAQSKDRAIDQQFEALVEMLREQRLSSVVKTQGDVQNELVKLLELLLSEDRSKRIESEKERIRDYLKRVNKIIKEQKSLQNGTERDDDSKQLADRQGELSQETKKLADDVREAEESNAPSKDSGKKSEESPEGESEKSPGAEGKEGEQKDGKKKDDDKEDAEKKPDAEKDDPKKDDAEKPENKDEKDEEKKDSEKSDGEKSQGEKSAESESKPGEPSPSKPQEGTPKESPSSPGESDKTPPPEAEEKNPAQKRLERAQQRMEQAQKKLEEAKQEEAIEAQEEALRELEQAKAELEEILRQLREEEMARTLAMLEARFRKMLEVQVQVYEGTQRLDKVAEVDRDRDDAIEAGRLSRKQAEIAIEADKALNLLQEEGSAVAFPEAVIEIRDDMFTVRDWLGEAKVGELTQGVEQDIIASLEEMITALEKAQQEMQDKQKSPPPGGGGEDEMPLVDSLAELKMIRALQMRVNKRTQRYAELSKTEQVDEPEMLESLRKLSQREQRIHNVTRDIVLGRNR